MKASSRLQEAEAARKASPKVTEEGPFEWRVSPPSSLR